MNTEEVNVRNELIRPLLIYLPDPGFEPRAPILQADTSASEPPGKPYLSLNMNKNNTEENVFRNGRDILINKD